MRPTHFLCLPLITPTSLPQLEHSLADLRDSTDHGDCKVPQSAFRPLGVLHLTLGVLSLTPERLKGALQMLQDTDLEALLKWAGNRPLISPSARVLPASAAEPKVESSSPAPSSVLHSLKRAISPPRSSPLTSSEGPRSQPQPQPLVISLRGLSAFPDARRATVLHARPDDPSDRLYCFCLAVRQTFIDASFMLAEERPMVLHATLVNTVYSKSGRERKGESGRGAGRITMDARELVRRLNGRVTAAREEEEEEEEEEDLAFVWAADVEIDRVRICKMGAKTVDDPVLGMEYEVVGEKTIVPG